MRKHTWLIQDGTALANVSPLKITRGIIDAILSGAILTAPTKKIPFFNFEVPTELPGVDPAILDPRDTYADAAEWETKAKDLSARFIKNFAKYEGNAAGKAWYPLAHSYNYKLNKRDKRSGCFDSRSSFFLFITPCSSMIFIPSNQTTSKYTLSLCG